LDKVIPNTLQEFRFVAGKTLHTPSDVAVKRLTDIHINYNSTRCCIASKLQNGIFQAVPLQKCNTKYNSRQSDKSTNKGSTRCTLVEPLTTSEEYFSGKYQNCKKN